MPERTRLLQVRQQARVLQELAACGSDTLLGVDHQADWSCRAGKCGKNARSATAEGGRVLAAGGRARCRRAGRRAIIAKDLGP